MTETRYDAEGNKLASVVDNVVGGVVTPLAAIWTVMTLCGRRIDHSRVGCGAA